jgi:DNA-binding transcriptional ArsR family regulator
MDIKSIPSEFIDTAGLFIALGDERQQRILLSFEKGEKLNIVQLVSNSVLSRTTVTHHIKVLKHAGVLDSEKVGKEVFFGLIKRV